MQIKPQMVEAVMFFTEQGISKQMFYAEFEALLDGVVGIPEYANQQIRMAYVLISPQLLIKSIVLFYLKFDSHGAADRQWNIPLQSLVSRAEAGPDLGAGPIRFVSRSQCPLVAQQNHLWDATATQINWLCDAVKANSLAVLVEEVPAQFVLDRLQMAAEDNWYSTQANTSAQALAGAAAKEQVAHQQRLRAAQLIKQLRLRMAEQLRTHQKQVADIEHSYRAELLSAQAHITELQQALIEQQALNAKLEAALREQAKHFQQAREEMSAQLRMFERDGQDELLSMQEQLRADMAVQVGAVTRLYQEQLAGRDQQLSTVRGQLNEAQHTLLQTQQNMSIQAEGSADQTLQALAKLGISFVVYHPGAGHLTIALPDLARYQDNPLAYVASKCRVSEEQYRQWLEHYQQPICSALLSNGDRCGLPLDRVEVPNRFIVRRSNCCQRHQHAQNVTTAG